MYKNLVLTIAAILFSLNTLAEDTPSALEAAEAAVQQTNAEIESMQKEIRDRRDSLVLQEAQLRLQQLKASDTASAYEVAQAQAQVNQIQKQIEDAARAAAELAQQSEEEDQYAKHQMILVRLLEDHKRPAYLAAVRAILAEEGFDPDSFKLDKIKRLNYEVTINDSEGTLVACSLDRSSGISAHQGANSVSAAGTFENDALAYCSQPAEERPEFVSFMSVPEVESCIYVDSGEVVELVSSENARQNYQQLIQVPMSVACLEEEADDKMVEFTPEDPIIMD